MQISEIIDGIVAKKNEQKLTTQQIADASGVPKSTVDRILRGATENPSMQNVLDIANAVGYVFGPQGSALSATPVPEMKDPMVQYIFKLYEDRIRADRSAHNVQLAEKNRWLKLSLVLNIILIGCICGVLIYDVTHPDVGWFRRDLLQQSADGMRNMLSAVCVWLHL